MRVKSLIGAVLALALNTTAQATDEFPEITEDGLHKLKDTDLALVYAQPGADISGYSKVMLVDASVSFKKNWQRNQNRGYPHKVTANDMDRIRTELAGLFREVFKEELASGGYELTEEAGEDVLLVRPAIINLDIVAPDTRSPGRTYQYAESAGEMTLYVELYDSVTGDIIAKALDRQRDRRSGYFEWQTRVTNTAAAKRILKGWAKVLREGLDEARTIKPEE
jgi:hypothetical protein